jgi:beta-glucosidase
MDRGSRRVTGELNRIDQPVPAYQDPRKTVEDRVRDLLGRMTPSEKISQMLYDSPAIERLGIPAYNWWNECLHGVGRAGIATVFPQAIALAATWNQDLVNRIAEAISDEARAKHHDALRRGVHDIYYGLTFWTPNINIFRDPRWGRGQETYGEDPHLTARMGVAFVKGLQGRDGRYIKVVATPKHFAVHSGPEAGRHQFNAVVSERDLRMTYLPAFEACVKEGQAWSIMGAYNRTNGEACNASPTLLGRILRDEWKFHGYVVSDCGAITDIYKHHRLCTTVEEAAAMAVRAGCDLSCDCAFSALLEAAYMGLISENEVNQALTRLFTVRFRLGMFDPEAMVPYASIPMSVNDSAEHRALARKAAQQSIILLKNDGLLPLSKDIGTIAVIGPNADDIPVLLGNYNGTPSVAVTPLEGIRAAVSPQTGVLYARGCKVAGQDESGFPEALAAAQAADVVVFAGGLCQALEGEEGQQEGVEEGMSSSGDRSHLNLPGVQEKLLQALYALGKPVVLVLLNGSALSVRWAKDHLPAILEAWYPGEEGGSALADILFGDVSPSGRLPVTFYASVDDLPSFIDYRMEGRTYRYFRGEPQFPFGYGLSYTTFQYANLTFTPSRMAPGGSLTASVEVKNTGAYAGEEVIQVYVSDLGHSPYFPIRQLCGFQRVFLQPGQSATVVLRIKSDMLAVVDDSGRRFIQTGMYQVQIGGCQPGPEHLMPPGASLLTAEFEVC